MQTETDAAFLKRVLAELDARTAANGGETPGKVELASADLIRLVKLYAGIPATAIRMS